MFNKTIKKNLKIFSKRLAEYEQESGETITMHDFFINVLNYSEDDYMKFTRLEYRVKKRRKEIQNKRLEQRKKYFEKQLNVA